MIKKFLIGLSLGFAVAGMPSTLFGMEKKSLLFSSIVEQDSSEEDDLFKAYDQKQSVSKPRAKSFLHADKVISRERQEVSPSDLPVSPTDDDEVALIMQRIPVQAIQQTIPKPVLPLPTEQLIKAKQPIKKDPISYIQYLEWQLAIHEAIKNNAPGRLRNLFREMPEDSSRGKSIVEEAYSYAKKVGHKNPLSVVNEAFCEKYKK